MGNARNIQNSNKLVGVVVYIIYQPIMWNETSTPKNWATVAELLYSHS